jgi:hypothetical protein
LYAAEAIEVEVFGEAAVVVAGCGGDAGDFGDKVDEGVVLRGLGRGLVLQGGAGPVAEVAAQEFAG